MFNESDDKNFVSAMLKNQLGLNINQEDITLYDKENHFDQLTFKANVGLDDLLPYLDSYISELIKHNASYSETELLRTKMKYFLKVYEKSGFESMRIRGYHNSLSSIQVVDIPSLILKGSAPESVDDAIDPSLRKKIYQNRMSVDGKVLIARFALKQFFYSDFGDFIHEFEKSISRCLNVSLQVIKSVKDSFNRLEKYRYQRRVTDVLTMNIELNTDEYPACMPDLYIRFNESEGTTGVYRDDEKLIELYTCVSSGKDVPVISTVRFTGSEGSALYRSSQSTFCSVGPTGRVQICDRATLVHKAIEELRDVV